MTPVKNQQSCGSCWAFSATETVESANCIATGYLYKLSPQQLVDCVTTCYGCGGGWYSNAWTYLRTSAQELAADYPYTSRDGYCQYDASYGYVYTTSGGHDIVGSSLTDMQDRLNQQPISV